MSREEDGNRILLRKGEYTLEVEKGGYYDRFRDRLTFPLMWTNTAAVGFGGRALDDSTATGRRRRRAGLRHHNTEVLPGCPGA